MRGGGRRPFGIFPKIHLIWLPDPSLRGLLSGRVQSCYDNVSEKQCFDLGFIGNKICYIKYISYDIYVILYKGSQIRMSHDSGKRHVFIRFSNVIKGVSSLFKHERKMYRLLIGPSINVSEGISSRLSRKISHQK